MVKITGLTIIRPTVIDSILQSFINLISVKRILTCLVTFHKNKDRLNISNKKPKNQLKTIFYIIDSNVSEILFKNIYKYIT